MSCDDGVGNYAIVLRCGPGRDWPRASSTSWPNRCEQPGGCRIAVSRTRPWSRPRRVSSR